MRTSEKSSTIAAALYAVHRDLENPRKDAKGQVRGRQNYRYLSLPALIDHAKAALKEAGVAVIQEVGYPELPGTIGVTTRFLHLAGEWLEVGPLVMPAPNDPQQVGSAITYARRYALAAALNLAADEDDDASAASSPAQGHTSDAAPGAASVSGRDGAAAGSGGEGAVQGEGAAPEPPRTPPRDNTNAQATMDYYHPGKAHRMKASPTDAGVSYCTRGRIDGGTPCDYIDWGTSKAKAAEVATT